MIWLYPEKRNSDHLGEVGERIGERKGKCLF